MYNISISNIFEKAGFKRTKDDIDKLIIPNVNEKEPKADNLAETNDYSTSYLNKRKQDFERTKEQLKTELEKCKQVK